MTLVQTADINIPRCPSSLAIAPVMSFLLRLRTYWDSQTSANPAMADRCRYSSLGYKLAYYRSDSW